MTHPPNTPAIAASPGARPPRTLMGPPGRTPPRPGQAPSVMGRRYLDDLVDDYVSWREACAVVSGTYDNWKHAGREDEKLAFCEYIAVLNCEEEAAALYQQSVERLATMPSALRGASRYRAQTEVRIRPLSTSQPLFDADSELRQESRLADPRFTNNLEEPRRAEPDTVKPPGRAPAPPSEPRHGVAP